MLVISDPSLALTPTAIALGNFDGLHRGHQRVIKPVLGYAPHLVPTVVTFDPHPQEFFHNTTRLLLTPISEKIVLLEQMGIEQLVLLPFNAQLAKLDPQAFIHHILIKHLQAQQISVGFDFHFGHQRCGSVQDLQTVWGDRINVVPKQVMDGSAMRISSSAVRTALAQGEIATANLLLGRAYSLTGTVVTGEQMGRQIGFPTANLKLHPQKFLPRDGVYAVKAKVTNDALEPNLAEVNAVMNIGMRPTVANGELKRTVEVHLLNWQGDLYGQELTVQLVKFLRSEKKFTGLDQLKAQIQADCEAALAIDCLDNTYLSASNLVG